MLARSSIPLVVLPLLASTGVLVADGERAATRWSRFPLVQMTSIQLYGFIVVALRHAPIYGWLLLVSGWAVLPPLAVCVVAWIAFGDIARRRRLSHGSGLDASQQRTALTKLGKVDSRVSSNAATARPAERSRVDDPR